MSEGSRRRPRRKSGEETSPSSIWANHAVAANPFQAFRDVCYLYGVDDLADALGMKRGTLYNKADADVDSHNQPTLRDVINVTRVTLDHRVLESLDRMFDRAGFDVKPLSVCSDEALLELLCNVGKEKGELCTAVHRALKAERFTPEHLQRIRAEAFDVVAELMAFLQRLEGLVDE